ncbi:NAD(P)-dependent dehydrogenase (short-subunit alcohol dehydrogenase family) [Pseudomonas citronellolis]|uniref:SDR family oxidoreductase n=1 Tax=Pseudomonas citronellolis TaxID=53408 RepID=UPI0020A2259A|nr:SDR family oxidoreductase [Pseudomonas citronellolis]MCP1645330.1 NAD(P)-dependent dehydrogenase (short-subunit alcohol dehydrogenase family) [Pseudomonas citronellolis]MCP1669443.1 NAD(P)-dependent dehydrogenase (short-subunit alcohol dehydrogenase family) [Pseudomonas citronellolis]MCP1699708.1 NAD(P)-dependent dehydrogenase (short-subunit alcohol dehydrogenase family) [Pseudomonas citronellolis]MCP1707335.1 NAD(P)-dependent dehydrogenase (short-subunit alcohol dehydrogenase family) [Pseud
MTQALDFSGQVVLVTGGAKGVGRGISQRFLEHGAEVVICGREAPAQLPSHAGREAWFVPCDVRDFAQLEALMEAIDERYGRLDVLINNAGGAPYAQAADASPRFSEAIVRLNLLAPLNLCQLANQRMQKQANGGSIINICSVSATRPSPGTAAYGAAKAGLLNLGRSLAVEWAPKVRINAVIGGLIRTEQSHLHYGDEAGLQRVAATVPLGRLAEPGDIGDACLYLASPLAAYVSGAELALHGGGERPAFLDSAQG